MATVSSNDAIEIVIGTHKFHPTFTYPIYGENELIYGYEGLNIRIEYDPVSLLPLVEMSYSGEPTPDADDPVKTLLEFMPENTFTDRTKWEEARKSEFSEPPGTPVFEIDGGYSVRKSKVQEVVTFLERFRTFVLFFIEAGSFIDQEDYRWDVYVLIESKSKAFAGFVTVYPYFYYSNASEFEKSQEMLVKKRISQFVVLPPYQHKGLGVQLYTGLVEEFQLDPRVKQITVEDPNEAFDVLRDRADLVILAKDPEWSQLSLPLDTELFTTITKRSKLIARQVRRCLEIALLGKYDSEPMQYRKLVKERLFEHNYEGLKDLDEGTQAIMLRDVYSKVVEDYRKYLTDTIEPAAKRQKVA